MSFFDESTPFGERAARRLREDKLAWLTTVRKDGTPQPSPVWFLWDGADGFLLYSQAETQKLRNIARNGRVSLHLDGDGHGGNIVIVTGEATVVPEAPLAAAVPEYGEKYAWGFDRLGLTAEEFGERYPVPIQIRATGLRGH